MPGVHSLVGLRSARWVGIAPCPEGAGRQGKKIGPPTVWLMIMTYDFHFTSALMTGITLYWPTSLWFDRRLRTDCLDPHPVAWCLRLFSNALTGKATATARPASSDTACVVSASDRISSPSRPPAGQAFARWGGVALQWLLLSHCGQMRSLSCAWSGSVMQWVEPRARPCGDQLRRRQLSG